ncbi:hypothetical protein MY04_4197 [Flammeovirga sp. MY04]|uniref:hypothetical protein n=1 Tax=Flammeovirga sp. MY04 TaxID=1191459 RepID=UPI00080608E0|nr:hypothetical protein [Flammeovirga sp. MY04]ANQ51539.1 hypothetical protein MY04_4197 [Flammeovirga sp. MY04]
MKNFQHLRKVLLGSAILCTLFTSCSEDELANLKDSNAVFQEQEGMIVVEVETTPAEEGWTENTATAGFTGTSYYQNSGDAQMNNPGESILEYSVQINTPGTYRFIWHNKVNEGDNTTEANDSWLRILGAHDFFGKKNATVKYPKGGTMVQSDKIVNGSSKDGWMKVFCSGTLDWSWATRTSDHEGLNIYATFNEAGTYTVQISRRSTGHAIDRFVLYNEEIVSKEEAEDLSNLESR